MDYISVAVSVLIEMVIVYLFCNRLQERKTSNAILIGTIILGTVINFAVYFIFLNNSVLYINIVTSFITFSLFSVICFKGKIYTQFIYGVLLSLFMIISEFICMIPFTYKVVPMIVNEDLNTITAMLFSLVSKIMFLIISQITAIIISRHSVYIHSSDKRYAILLAVPVFSFVIVFCNILICTNVSIDKSVEFVLRLSMVVLAVLSIAVFVYYQIFEENETKIRELEKEKRLVELNNAYMQMLEHQNSELQMVFHDTKHHFMALDNMDDADEMKAYIHKIVPAINSNNINVSSNKMLNLLLNKYIVICKSKGIKFTYDVKTVSLDYIDDSELSILICNILDNAIESAEQSKDKTINISIKHINSMDLLSVENSCDIEPKHKNGKLITSKADAQNHGYGIKIIEKHSKMNNGQMEWSYDNIEHIFHLNILFQR